MKKFKVRTCPICKSEFSRKDPDTIHCSPHCRRVSQVGAKSPSWKGGMMITPLGYRLILSKDHPHKNAAGYVFEHRLVMEKKIKRYLEPNEKVHHKNGVKLDNRVSNLEIVTSNMHYGEVVCPHCNHKFLVR